MFDDNVLPRRASSGDDASALNPRDAALLERLRAHTRFRELVHVDSCASTQELAATANGDTPTIFWADHQTAGRGRHQGIWNDASSLDLAVTLRLGLQLDNPTALPAVVPLCVLQAVNAATALVQSNVADRTRLKWPNDVLLDDRKLAGVLIDASGGAASQFLIGIGLNVNRTQFPRELEPIATSLALATGHEHDRHQLLFELARALCTAADVLLHGDAAGIARLEADYSKHLGLLDRDVVIECERELRTRLIGLDFREARVADGPPIPLGQIRAMRAQ